MSSAAPPQDLCVFCRKVCRPRQHCLQCDFCFHWQHRTCETGVTQAFYRQLVKGEATLDNWPCYVCRLTQHLPTAAITPLDEVTSETTREDGSIFVPTATASAPFQPDDLVISTVHSTVRSRAIAPTADEDDGDAKSPDDDDVPLWLVSSPSSASSTSVSAESVTIEDQISVLYLEDSPLPLPPSTTLRSPYMSKLVCLDSSSEEELRSYLPSSPQHATLSTPRLPVSPNPEYQPKWSTATDSPLSSPCPTTPENQRLPPHQEMWSSATDSLLPTPAAVISETSYLPDTTCLHDDPLLFPSPYPVTPATPSQVFVRNDSSVSPSPSHALCLYVDVNTSESDSDSDRGSASPSGLDSPLQQIRKRLIEELKL